MKIRAASNVSRDPEFPAIPMTTVAIIIALWLGLLAVVQGALVIGFAAAIRRPARTLPVEFEYPKAAVILCLRGTDPFLGETLRAIGALNYPDFTVHIIVDHAQDPAWPAVNGIVAEFPAIEFQLHTLADPLTTCSLKCSSLIQVIKSLDESVQIVAQLDADTIPHRTWLRELAGALQDESVGAATGNRWYLPDDIGWGSLVRTFWNSAAVVQMYWYRIAWGGTLAMRTEVIREAGLLEHWSRAFCEDTMLFEKLGAIGKRVEFVPSLLMVNRESCSVSGFFRWVTRQLLTARLYHPRWPLVVSHGISTILVPAIGVAILAVAIARGEWIAAAILFVAIAVFQLENLLWLWILDRAGRFSIARRGERIDWLQQGGWQLWLRLPAAMVLTQFVYCGALCKCLMLNRTTWRQVDYRVKGPWDIESTGYRRWKAIHHSEKHSL